MYALLVHMIYLQGNVFVLLAITAAHLHRSYMTFGIHKANINNVS